MSGFQIGDRIFGGPLGRPQHEFRVREVSPTGALRIQEVDGPRLPLWISASTASEWAHAEALSEDADRSETETLADPSDEQVVAWFRRHVLLGTDFSHDAYPTIAYRRADHAGAMEDDAAYRQNAEYRHRMQWQRTVDEDHAKALTMNDMISAVPDVVKALNATEPRCTRPSNWTGPHLFEDDEIELNPEGYDEYERCERPADDPLHIEGAHAEALSEDAERSADTCPDCGVTSGDRHELSCPTVSIEEFRAELGVAVPTVPADLNDDAAWAEYCAALPDPTEAEIAAVLAEHTGPYAEQIAHSDEGFRAAARMIRQWRSEGGLSERAYRDLRAAMSNYASNGRIYRTLTGVYALGLISDAHLAASHEGADAYGETFGTVAS